MEFIHLAGKPPIDTQSQVLLIGKFDGVHKGHIQLLQTARSYLEAGDILSVMSFSEHPLWVLRQNPEYKHSLTPVQEKIKILSDFGVKRFYQIAFTQEYAQVLADDFVLEHLLSLHIKRIVVGEGFRFGHKGQGDIQKLILLCSQIGVQVTVVPHINANGEKISSTTIRNYVLEGKVEAAQALLGRPYRITGHVIHGDALGRQLGFPTANLETVDGYILPKPGIYAGIAEIHSDLSGNEFWNCLISAGYRSTVGGTEYCMEAHLLDYSGNLYDKTLSLSFLSYFRDEIEFNNLDALVDQMNIDKDNATAFFGTKR
ncbi:bifunctional riboflavin kinase/FAD synthetase [Paenibacillus sp. SC116]|uniref:bifunctional riboflavin kinase/FAD synthetase n=1 Tax=Paenibacillus sp. SC116 TaxID=2968986 RepID=UPI00215A0F3B|nr:bifunctional riboflavin kinase/FAD synthetase [Paenibacillus sp. SC116]MCR8842383.1 bifunctional riboflavin kinase/FAD synthetase [Paenibacillus sp. SC116]